MFLIPANTVIQIEAKKSLNHWNTVGWVPYTTKEDKLYDKEEVWDSVAVHNGREMPFWALHNITEHNKVVVSRAGKFAMVKPGDIQYLD